MISNKIAEITIKRYTKLTKSKEKLNFKLSQVIDDFRNKNCIIFDVKKLLRYALQFDGN
jgi:hypothetical protein